MVWKLFWEVIISVAILIIAELVGDFYTPLMSRRDLSQLEVLIFASGAFYFLHPCYGFCRLLYCYKVKPDSDEEAPHRYCPFCWLQSLHWTFEFYPFAFHCGILVGCIVEEAIGRVREGLSVCLLYVIWRLLSIFLSIFFLLISLCIYLISGEGEEEEEPRVKNSAVDTEAQTIDGGGNDSGPAVPYNHSSMDLYSDPLWMQTNFMHSEMILMDSSSACFETDW